ncbi:MAG: rRNA maturation RNase YbeY [Rhizobiaceae bacterium]
MIEIDIAINEGNWAGEGELQALSKNAIEAATLHLEEQLPDGAEVSLLFTDDAQMQSLNKDWREQDKPTNVLSFAANEGDGPDTPLLGDIILAFETVKREADEQRKPFEHHLTHLIIHGFLHLLGYDHIDDDEAEQMELLETKLLAGLEISDPYLS